MDSLVSEPDPKGRIARDKKKPVTCEVTVVPPTGWVISDRKLMVPSALHPVSDEPRTVEFELRAPTHVSPGAVRVSGYALYGVCEGPSGTCLFRRADLTASIQVK